RNAHIHKSPSLIRAQHFESMDPPSPKPRDAEQQIKKQSLPPLLSNETLRMKIRDAVDKMFLEHNIKWRDEMLHQRRAASKPHGIRRSHSAKCRFKQQEVRGNRPNRPEPKLFLLVFRTMDFNHLECAYSNRLGRLTARIAAG